MKSIQPPIRLQPLMVVIVAALISALMGAFAFWDNILVHRGAVLALENEGRLVAQEFAFGVEMHHEADRILPAANTASSSRSVHDARALVDLQKEMKAVMTIRHNVKRVDLLTEGEEFPRIISYPNTPLSLKESQAHTVVISHHLNWISVREPIGTRSGLYVVVPFLHHNKKLGTVGVLISLYEADMLAQREQNRTLLLLLSGFLLLAFLLSIVVKKLVLNPLYQVSQAMERVGEGDLDVRVDPVGTFEIRQFSGGFNKMLSILSDRTEENRKLLKRVQEFNDTLTNKINEATHELIQKNASLEEAGRNMFFFQRKLSELEKMAAIGESLAIVAHELGNPLHSISGHVELSLEEEGLPPSVEKHLHVILGQIDRMIKAIRKLLSMSRRDPPPTTSLNLPSLIEDIIVLVQPRTQSMGIDISHHFPADCPLVQSDRESLQGIFLNFIENAIDASGQHGKIEITGHQNGDYVEIHVKDSGPGVPEELVERIFEPFFTTKSHGTGLGLAISRKIIDDLGGSLSLGAGPGGHFVVMVPVVPNRVSNPLNTFR
ncbi:MAG: ATP-binding protein [Nitrospiraceae bacterium]|jgi:signal transduction histidine kinase|nr:ATP-binding protein [Nitrospiraceae bacterium]